MTDLATRGPQPQGTVRKRIAWFAEAWKGWDYEDTLNAIIAAGEAGWPDERIYRELVRLLSLEDAAPADLRQAARDPRRGIAAVDAETVTSGLAAVREAYENRRLILNAPRDDDPEDGRVA